MTTSEFSTELDVIYENINKNGAPGLDEYEKSVVLTHAQELLVKEYLKVNPTGDDFPDLISVHSSSTVNPGDYGTWSYRFPLPTSYLKILNERVVDAGGDNLIVLPISNEELQIKKSKAYQYPARRRAWRISSDNSGGQAEIFVRSGFTPTNYYCRYVRKPVPIILTNLAALTPTASIDGIAAVTECELDVGWHRDILKLASGLAEQYYMDKYGTNGNQ